jgi:hypothetical protein
MDRVASQYSWHHSFIVKWTINPKALALSAGPGDTGETKVGHLFFKTAADTFFLGRYPGWLKAPRPQLRPPTVYEFVMRAKTPE